MRFDSGPSQSLRHELRVRRMAGAIELVRSKRDGDGRWPLENQHPGEVHFPIDDAAGMPSRWNTLRAMRVLRWYGQAPT